MILSEVFRVVDEALHTPPAQYYPSIHIILFLSMVVRVLVQCIASFHSRCTFKFMTVLYNMQIFYLASVSSRRSVKGARVSRRVQAKPRPPSYHELVLESFIQVLFFARDSTLAVWHAETSSSRMPNLCGMDVIRAKLATDVSLHVYK